MIKTAISLLAITILSGCVTASQWQANRYYDEFTGETSCQVEMGSSNQREFGRAMTGTYFSYNFFAENHDGEIRAGVRSEPAIPINGDVQIKAGDNLYTITAADTPLDSAPAMPTVEGSDEFNKSYAATMDTIQKLASPYRVLTGEKAQALIADILKTQEEIKFRTVGVNTATSGTGSFTVDDNFRKALRECHITD